MCGSSEKVLWQHVAECLVVEASFRRLLEAGWMHTVVGPLKATPRGFPLFIYLFGGGIGSPVAVSCGGVCGNHYYCTTQVHYNHVSQP